MIEIKDVKLGKCPSRRKDKWGNVENKGKGENSGANVRFTEIENGSHRNAVIAICRAESLSEENDSGFGDRGVLISKTISGKMEW